MADAAIYDLVVIGGRGCVVSIRTVAFSRDHRVEGDVRWPQHFKQFAETPKGMPL